VNFAPGQRVSGELRTRYLDHLAGMCQQEYVDLDEMNARMEAMLAARTEEELKFLLHDLPALKPVPGKEKHHLGASVTFFIPFIAMFAVAIVSSFQLTSASGQIRFSLATAPAVAFGFSLATASAVAFGVASILAKKRRERGYDNIDAYVPHQGAKPTERLI